MVRLGTWEEAETQEAPQGQLLNKSAGATVHATFRKNVFSGFGFFFFFLDPLQSDNASNILFFF